MTLRRLATMQVASIHIAPRVRDRGVSRGSGASPHETQRKFHATPLRSERTASRKKLCKSRMAKSLDRNAQTNVD
ncbi:hypothetical protein M404DRAFT_212482 [Pisolithus tinctorius Marx 270]|uniref:Uncharacterized protein n=1 Tax=Pisolithus tinctorius Marx 270 TaxID=870435 RepID=A0A0C3P8K6_PISTI|nr:hypothetical protein M404DRAFT_212482 [Pisolithus tinctorius Marx 270]